jgi:hypothetical protein
MAPTIPMALKARCSALFSQSTSALVQFRSELLIPLAAAGVCLTVALLPITPAVAQDLPDRPETEMLLPETTVAMAKMTSFSEFFDKMKTSLGAQMIEDESLAPLVERLYEVGEEQYGRIEETVGLSLDELKTLPSGEMTIALVAPRRKDPAVVVILELDDENEAVDKAMGRLREVVEGENAIEEVESDLEELTVEKAIVRGNPVFFCRYEGVMVGSSSREVLEDIFLRWSGGENEKVRPLSENRKFITISNRCSTSDEFPADAMFYVDPIGIFKANAKGNAGMQMVVAMLPAFGLDGLLAAGGNMYVQTEGYETIMHGHVMLASPREGLFDAIALKPGEYRPQDWVPVNIGSYMTTSWDAQQMYAGIEEISNTLSEGSFDEFLQGVKNTAGFDLKEAIIDEMNGRVTFVRPILSGDQFNAIGNVFAIGLNDPEKFDEFLEAQLTGEKSKENWSDVDHEGIRYWTMGDVGKRREESRKKWMEENKRKVDPEKEARRQYMRKNMRQSRPSCVVLGDSLIFGDSEEFIKIAIDTYNGNEEALANDKEFQRHAENMTKLLKTDVPSAMLFSDSARELDVMTRAIGSDSLKELLAEQAEDKPENFQGLKDALDENPLPDYDFFRKYIPTSGGFVTSDDSGYHFLLFQESRLVED